MGLGSPSSSLSNKKTDTEEIGESNDTLNSNCFVLATPL